MPFLTLKNELASSLAKILNHPEVTAKNLFDEFSTPPNITLGHLALPCFKLSKTLKLSPPQIGQKVIEGLKNRNDFSAQMAGPYVNFKISPQTLLQSTLTEILSRGKNYGADANSKGQTVLVEYCSPNIAKPLAFQHIRSTLIGNVLANVYSFLNYKTIRMNFIGDWGTQFAKLLAAIEKWGDKSKVSLNDISQSMQHLFELYVKFHKEAENNPDYNDVASKYLQRLEKGDSNAIELWKIIREVSVESMKKTMQRLNVHFDLVEGESQYTHNVTATLERIKKDADAKLSEGAWIVEVEGVATPGLIQKKDGTTLYLTRDIAAAEDRKKRLKFDKMLYIVSEQQRLHFQLLFGVIEKMGHAWSKECEHVSFGTVLFGEEKMSTRMGKVVFLEDILNQAKKLALDLCSEKNPNLANKEQVAEDVGMAAVIFGELSTHRVRDFEFDWNQVLAFDGETGPYVQYSLVRCYSLLEKAKFSPGPAKGFDGALIEEEEALLICLSKFRSILHDVIRENEPFYLTKYLVELAKAFNRFYYKVPVIQSQSEELKNMRLLLVHCSQTVLENGLRLLGIRCPKEM